MRFVMFYHSLLSDWNHGNAHFLRGVVRELRALGHEVTVYEPADGWSLQSLRAESGRDALRELEQYVPTDVSRFYDLETLDLDEVLDGADVVIVHEWNEHELVRRIGRHRQRAEYRLLFHDTHHRSVTDRAAMARYDLQHYDGVLAFGRVIRELYLREGWATQAWTWHEAADTTLFQPHAGRPTAGDLVWIGNWGDEERTAELCEFLLEPVSALQLRARVHGVRYPAAGRAALAAAGVEYAGWLPNYLVPQAFAQHRVTIHVPRRPYRERLPGIPTIRVFEALACGIPLVSAAWDDLEELFEPGRDFLVARSGREMRDHLRSVLADPAGLAAELARSGRDRILSRHTCRHRVDELLRICHQLGAGRGAIPRLQPVNDGGPQRRRQVAFAEREAHRPWMIGPPRGALPPN